MIPVVRLHPYGGFAVVQMHSITEGAPAVIPGYHDRFMTFRAACAAAEQEEEDESYLVASEII
jgi:hypothetical protein